MDENTLYFIKGDPKNVNASLASLRTVFAGSNSELDQTVVSKNKLYPLINMAKYEGECGIAYNVHTNKESRADAAQLLRTAFDPSHEKTNGYEIEKVELDPTKLEYGYDPRSLPKDNFYIIDCDNRIS